MGAPKRRIGVVAQRCVGVCIAVAAVLLTSPAAGAFTWSPQSVPAPQGRNGEFFAVSCTSSTSCMAVGFFLNPLGEQRPLAETWNGASWTVKTVPMPSGTQFGYLRGVSCTSATACTAVGAAGPTNLPTQPLAERWNGTSWAVQTVPNPANTIDVTFTGVSCTSGTACTAVGSARNTIAGHSVALAERWNGSSWAVQTSPNPSGAGAIELTGVACTGASECIAVGYYTSSGAVFFPDKTLAERWNGSSWSIQTTPNPSGATAAILDGISCSAGTACTAVGGYSTTTNLPNQTLAERWNGASWTIQSTPNPASGTPLLGGVSCPAAAACTAVGSAAPGSSSTPLIEHWNGASWAIQSAPSPAGAIFTPTSGVSCTAAAACTAVGAETGGSLPSTLAERLDGAGWTIQTTANVTGALVSSLDGVSCRAASSCAAVGSFLNGGKRRMLAEAWNGSSWRVKSMPNPATSRGILSAVSCTASTACTAVGSYLNGSGFTVTLAERWNGTSWAVQSTPNPAGSTNASLNGVSCPSATSCMAVGKFFDSNTSRWTRLAEQWNGTSWALKPTQNASGETFSTFNGVACTSSTSCTTVGGYSTAAGASEANRPLAEQWNGISWALKTTPTPAGATFATFIGVSCSASTACTAAGGYSTTPGANVATQTLAERWNGTSWTIQTTTNPVSIGFNGDSCPTATTCVAVGNFFAEGWNSATWATETITPVLFGSELAGVSCSAAAACTAVGNSQVPYVTDLLFANDTFIGFMSVPLAERDPASPSAPHVRSGVPGPAVNTIRAGSSADASRSAVFTVR
jgi:hypothetical protein